MPFLDPQPMEKTLLNRPQPITPQHLAAWVGDAYATLAECDHATARSHAYDVIALVREVVALRAAQQKETQ